MCDGILRRSGELHFGTKIYIIWDAQDVPREPMVRRKAAKVMEAARLEDAIN